MKIMKRERGQALILVLILLVVGALVTVPVLQLVSANLTARMMYGEFIKEDYAADAATYYALWKLKYDTVFTASLTFGEPSEPLYVTINGVTANSTVTSEASEGWMSGYGLIDHQIKPTKEVTPTTALPGVPTTFTYTITLERLEPDDELFYPLESIKDAMDAGFVYVPNSSVLDGVPFNDNDLTILEQPVIVSTVNSSSWSNIADEDAMVREDSPAQNYGAALTMDVSSGLPSSNTAARSFVKFDITSLSIPSGAVLSSATLRLRATSYPNATRTYEIHRVTEDWTEGTVNWSNTPAVAAVAVGRAPTPSDSATPMEWTVTADVADWLDGITTNYGWRISDDDEGLVTRVYSTAVIDTLEFDTDEGRTPVLIPVSGDIYAVAYETDGDGYLKTVQIAASGQITDTVIDTLVFDSQKGRTPVLIPVSGDIYAIAYTGDGDEGFLKTVEITSGGQITDTVIDSLVFDTQKGRTPDIISISGDVYAIAYEGDGGDGFLKTVQIAADGQITDAVIDTLEFDTVRGKNPAIIPTSGNFYAIAYTGSPADTDLGYLKTVKILPNGSIDDAVIDSLEFDNSLGKDPDIIPISGDVYAIAYAGATDDGFLKTVQIASSGTITDTVVDTLEFDTADGKTPKIIPISGDFYAIAYEGNNSDGFLKIFKIATDGQITDTVIDTLVFDTSKGKTPNIIPVSGDVYAIAYAGDSEAGFLKTVKIEFIGDTDQVTVFITKEDNDPGGLEPVLVVEYVFLGGPDFQTIEWIFEPDLDFDYSQDRTLSFQAIASLPDDSKFWNAVIIQPHNSYTGLTAPITVGNPPDTGIPGAGISVGKTADPIVVYAGIPTIVTYVISITNEDIGGFSRLDSVEDYLPPGFLYIANSATWAWPDDNSVDNNRPGYPYNNGSFEPEWSFESGGRQRLKWHNKDVLDDYPPYFTDEPNDGWDKVPADIALHDYVIPFGATYTLTFQALANVDVSGSYPNEVFVKLKDWGLYGDRGLDQDKEVYSWPTGEVVVPAYDILTETEHSILRTNAMITVAGIEIRSWHWKKHK